MKEEGWRCALRDDEVDCAVLRPVIDVGSPRSWASRRARPLSACALLDRRPAIARLGRRAGGRNRLGGVSSDPTGAGLALDRASVGSRWCAAIFRAR